MSSKDLSSLVSLLIERQQKLNELYSKLSVRDNFSSISTLKHRADLKHHAGYDWIASDLEAAASVKEYSENDLEELKIFRKSNHSECYYPVLPKSPIQECFNHSDNPTNSCSTCENFSFYNQCYSVNSRLFPEPATNCSANFDGKENEHKCVRISVPHNSLNVPYRIKSTRRKSVNTLDSMGISKHCMIGLQPVNYSVESNNQTIGMTSSVVQKQRK